MSVVISKNQDYLIREKIFLDLEIHIIEKRIKKAHSLHLEDMLRDRFKRRRNIKKQLHKEKIKINDPVRTVDFVQYYFSIKTERGFKEGSIDYWIAALKMHLNKRLNDTM